MTKITPIAGLVLALLLTACDPGAESDTGQATSASEEEIKAAREIAEALVQGKSDPDACGQGGTACPAGLDCVTWQGGTQACGPEAIDGLVMITDATLGGSCIVATAIDKLPGASIASVQVIDTDGSVKGWGRMVWDEPGYEVAAERGVPPDGTEFTGDPCTTAFNLGCDGKALFEIIDGSGQAQKLREGQHVIVHIRSGETCGDQFSDGIEAAICTDPGAASGGELESCSWKVRVEELRDEWYGPDRWGGTVGN